MPSNTYSLTSVWTPQCSPVFNKDQSSTKSCQPPDYEAIHDNHGHYSPGICFSGYTVGCDMPVASDIDPEVTVKNCVPRCVLLSPTLLCLYEKVQGS